ncbi:Serine/threonine-protein kinase RsbT [Enhygromyxa salina]|uniref:Serine/threonine-protein kinase RsbT n=1 Tax=Enhygromyxa salina TaxID=215803 RepID=A0A2S9Y7J8_9BACT|nr:ATP-binding protein [Enhygromyxa salina]PRQ01073.1 Serine/threonine-protein kinase RsbT [Enhygromyxa salina]
MNDAAQRRDDELVVPIRNESDLNHARMVTRETCKLVNVRGYQAQKIVTTVSELARNIARYASGGRVRFRVDATEEHIIIVAEDDGPGISNLDEILAGDYRSRTGLGRGLLGSRELADHFHIETSAAGTIVTTAFRYGGRKTWTTSTT